MYSCRSMGLLSDPKTRAAIVNGISRYNNALALLCYIAGVAYFLALAYRPLNAPVYMSENALIPGLVEADFYDDNGAEQYYKEYKEYYKALKDKIEGVPANKLDESPLYNLPTEWLVSKMRAIGLDTYVHNYSFRYPVSILEGQVMRGQNVYGILRAPRAARTEAIVLSVPFRPPASDTGKTEAGMALLLGVAAGFRRKTYWAKDLIFVVSDNDEIGLQAWLSAYHHSPMEYIYSGELHGRSGAIQAALNLELGAERISRINLKLEGLNGQLPNLDLFNTAVRLIKKERITAALQKRVDPPNPMSYDGWEHSAKTMLYMMWNQASGNPTGNHGLFHRYHIEAITLQGVKLKNPKYIFGFEQVGRVIEGICRSLNNLLERFHQSFFFYLLPATERYVSIGLYFPPFGLLTAPILIKAIALWISYSYGSDDTPKKSEAKSIEKENEKGQDKQGENTGDAEDCNAGQNSETEQDQAESTEQSEPKEQVETEEAKAVTESSRGFSLVIPHFVMSALFGLVSYHGPQFFITTGAVFHMEPGEALIVGLFALQLSAMYFPHMLRKRTAQKGNMEGANWKLLKCLGLLVFGILLFATALINISLAFFIAVVSAPVAVMQRPTHSRFGNLLQYITLITISPVVSLVIIGGTNHLITSPTSLDDVISDPGALCTSAWEGAQHALLYTVVNSHMYGNWTYSLLTLAYWPVWVLFWSILWTDPL